MTKRISRDMARQLGVRGQQKRSHLIGSQKAGGAAFVESVPEIITLLCLEIDPRVRTVKPQAITVRLDIERAFSTRTEAVRAAPLPRLAIAVRDPAPERIYTPDFLAELVSGEQWLIESKSTEAFNRYEAELKKKTEVLNRLGFNFLVVPGAEVQQRGLHANLVHLRDAFRLQGDNETRDLMNQLETVLSKQPAEFLLGSIKDQVSQATILLGIVNGLLACDLKAGHFGVATKLWRAEGDLSHLQLLRLEV